MSNAQWQGKTSRRIQQRIVIEGQLVLQTPAQFGNGDSDDLTDMPLLVDAHDGVSPLLTGATLAGALRAYLWSRENDYRQADPKAPKEKPKKPRCELDMSLTEILFGGFKQHDDGKQSVLIIDDALGENYHTELRDGVRIDPQTRTAYVEHVKQEDGTEYERGHLYNMQVWSAGTTFPLRFELLVTHPRCIPDDDTVGLKKYQDNLKKALLTALQGLSDGGITLGGKKNRGFGQIAIKDWHVRCYDMSKAADLMAWLREGNEGAAEKSQNLENVAQKLGVRLDGLADQRSYFKMKAIFSLNGSLLIRANGTPNSNSPDMVHLSNHKGKPVLSGSSVAGALRQRARRILHLIDPAPEKWQKPHPKKEGEFVRKDHEWLTDLFGDEDMKKKGFKASRLIVAETEIEEAQFDLVQNRVAIDRFTGGALDSALFNEQPVFGKPQTRVCVNLRVIKPTKADIGLLLLLLKDLWTADLPLGGESNVGRGRLQGRFAEFKYKTADQAEPQEWCLSQESKEASIEFDNVTAEQLQKFVDVLHEEVKDGA